MYGVWHIPPKTHVQLWKAADGVRLDRPRRGRYRRAVFSLVDASHLRSLAPTAQLHFLAMPPHDCAIPLRLLSLL
jgi:hypothetical protein